MSRLWDNRLMKNRFGQVRSGWIILITMAVYYILALVSGNLIIELLKDFDCHRRHQSGNRRVFQRGRMVR